MQLIAATQSQVDGITQAIQLQNGLDTLRQKQTTAAQALQTSTPMLNASITEFLSVRDRMSTMIFTLTEFYRCNLMFDYLRSDRTSTHEFQLFHSVFKLHPVEHHTTPKRHDRDHPL